MTIDVVLREPHFIRFAAAAATFAIRGNTDLAGNQRDDRAGRVRASHTTWSGGAERIAFVLAAIDALP